jgi:hypothetical protein
VFTTPVNPDTTLTSDDSTPLPSRQLNSSKHELKQNENNKRIEIVKGFTNLL